MVCIIPASAWTWLVRLRKASAVIMSGAGFDAGEGNPGSVIILQKRLGVGTATVASSVGRGWSGFVRCSIPESPNGRSDDMGPPSSAKMARDILKASRPFPTSGFVKCKGCYPRHLDVRDALITSRHHRQAFLRMVLGNHGMRMNCQMVKLHENIFRLGGWGRGEEELPSVGAVLLPSVRSSHG
ncbi:hypothetical protein OPV22_016200 [Ensete ventricosum]|uniref:Uncharacterized protein n=1 Tax=Ensete ventricosum TaxID=4639 RepID=A0AAV8PE14_ENSVE|nr:hypothetical protein OPV22_016200 [Ensete ventricosum]